MTDAKIRALIAKTVQYERAKLVMEAQIKENKALLVAEAESRQEEATKTDGGGTSITFEGEDFIICRVTISGRALKSSIDGAGKAIIKIKEAAHGFFTCLFETELSHKPIADFRKNAVDLLGKKDGAKLIKLCENRGKTTVSFEVKEPT